MRLAVDVAGLHLKNPLIAASGTFGYGVEHAGFLDLNLLGGLVTKGLYLQPRDGCPTPRIAETPSGLPAPPPTRATTPFNPFEPCPRRTSPAFGSGNRG